MFSYQIGHMYWRYFLWNFVGRESDEEGAGNLLPWDAVKKYPVHYCKTTRRMTTSSCCRLSWDLFGVVIIYFRRKRDLLVLGSIVFTDWCCACCLSEFTSN